MAPRCVRRALRAAAGGALADGAALGVHLLLALCRTVLGRAWLGRTAVEHDPRAHAAGHVPLQWARRRSRARGAAARHAAGGVAHRAARRERRGDDPHAGARAPRDPGGVLARRCCRWRDLCLLSLAALYFRVSAASGVSLCVSVSDRLI